MSAWHFPKRPKQRTELRIAERGDNVYFAQLWLAFVPAENRPIIRNVAGVGTEGRLSLYRTRMLALMQRYHRSRTHVRTIAESRCTRRLSTVTEYYLFNHLIVSL